MDKENIKLPFWARSIEETFEALKTNRGGLSKEEAEKRISKFGLNRITGISHITKFGIFLEQFKSPLIFILIFAGLVTLVLSDIQDSIFIFLAVLVNSVLGFYQENKAENALKHLRSYIEERVRVFRNNREIEIDAKEIVPGDIIHVSFGMRIPADARLIEQTNMMVDEAILTGEALPVHKRMNQVSVSSQISERENILHGGTLVVGGSGTAVIYATGMDSEFGKIAELVAKKKDNKTPLQKSIKKFAWVTMIALFFIIGSIFVFGVISGRPLFDMFLISVAMAVGAVPEGLPIALTVILAVGVERLAKKNGIVRKLSAAETLGSATLILTDKTGTLTKAQMSISNIVPFNKLISNEEIKPHKILKLSAEQKNIVLAALMNTDVVINGEDKPIDEWEIDGRSLEVSLVREAAKLGVPVLKFKKYVEVTNEIPFNSKDKYSVVRVAGEIDFVTGIKKTKNDSQLIFFGAPEILLGLSSFKKEEYTNALDSINKMAFDGQRVLGVAYKKFSAKNNIKDRKFEKLIFLGVIGFNDPLRDGVNKAIGKVQKMGARVAIVTGDHRGTAMALSRELGWDVSDTNVIDGAQMNSLSDEELSAQIDSIKIFARVSPKDKVRILELYQKRGHIVAMTGDGVNDAPTLKNADIGIAVGAGTDVSKDVSDLILMDNKFETIVFAMEEGRKIISNIRKVMVYLLSDMFDVVFLIGGSIIMGLALPIGALQILWVNFFSDSFPAISYAFEKDYDGSKNTVGGRNVFDKEVVALSFGVGVLSSLFLFVTYWFLTNLGYEYKIISTFMFMLFGIYSLMASFSFKNLKKNIWEYKIYDNKYLLYGVSIGVLMMLIAIYVPFLQSILGTVALPLLWWVAVICFVLVNIAIVEIVKMFFIKHKVSKN